MQLLLSNKPTSLTCLNNVEYEMEWDSNDYLFKIDFNNKNLEVLNDQGYRMHDLVPEILVWGKGLDFQTVFIAREEDFDEVEMF